MGHVPPAVRYSTAAVVLALAALLVTACSETIGEPCDVGNVDEANPAQTTKPGGYKPTAKRNVQQCPFYYCIATQSKEQPRLTSCGYCTKECTTDGDCVEDGWTCKHAVDPSQFEALGFTPELASKMYCVNPNATIEGCERDENADNEALSGNPQSEDETSDGQTAGTGGTTGGAPAQ